MKTLEIGAFEAKTHFSQLLRKAEAGTVVTILHRGRRVAELGPAGDPGCTAARDALDRIAARPHRCSKAELLSLRDEGRER